MCNKQLFFVALNRYLGISKLKNTYRQKRGDTILESRLNITNNCFIAVYAIVFNYSLRGCHMEKDIWSQKSTFRSVFQPQILDMYVKIDYLSGLLQRKTFSLEIVGFDEH